VRYVVSSAAGFSVARLRFRVGDEVVESDIGWTVGTIADLDVGVGGGADRALASHLARWRPGAIYLGSRITYEGAVLSDTRTGPPPAPIEFAWARALEPFPPDPPRPRPPMPPPPPPPPRPAPPPAPPAAAPSAHRLPARRTAYPMPQAAGHSAPTCSLAGAEAIKVPLQAFGDLTLGVDHRAEDDDLLGAWDLLRVLLPRQRSRLRMRERAARRKGTPDGG